MNLPTWNNTCTMLFLIGIDRSYLPTRLLEIRIKPVKVPSKFLARRSRQICVAKRLVKQEFQGVQYCLRHRNGAGQGVKSTTRYWAEREA